MDCIRGLIDGLGDKYSVYYNAEDYQALQVSTTVNTMELVQG